MFLGTLAKFLKGIDKVYTMMPPTVFVSVIIRACFILLELVALFADVCTDFLRRTIGFITVTFGKQIINLRCSKSRRTIEENVGMKCFTLVTLFVT